jgi:hypothetical protein
MTWDGHFHEQEIAKRFILQALASRNGKDLQPQAFLGYKEH